MIDFLKRHLSQIGRTLEFYCVTSGLQDIAQRSEIGSYFDGCWGSGLSRNKQGRIEGLKSVITAKDKASIILNMSSQSATAYTGSRLCDPYESVLYIGDGLTDIYAMKAVQSIGGHAILVYDPDDPVSYQRTCGISEQLDSTVSLYPADYTCNSPLSQAIMLKLSGH